MATGKKTGGGSRLGKPNKVTRDVKEMILGALDKAGGMAYLARQAVENPAPFMALVGRTLPKDINANVTQTLVITQERKAEALAGLMAALEKVRVIPALLPPNHSDPERPH